MTNIQEIWQDIPDYEGIYKVSNFGRVLAVKTNLIKKASDNGSGYLSISLYKDNKEKRFYIHRLVTTVFINNPENLREVNHKNFNKKDNSINNLEWCSSSYNKKHSQKNGKFAEGEKHGNAKINAEIVIKIRELKKSGQTCKDISKIFNISPANVCLITNKKAWNKVI